MLPVSRLARPGAALVMSMLVLPLGLSRGASAGEAGQSTPTAGVAPITIEGCLTKEGRQGESSAAEQFVVALAPRASAAPAANTGGTVPAPAVPTMYALRSAAEAPVVLANFVNHRVKVEGTTTAGATTAPLGGRSPEATPYQAPVATGSAGAGATGTPFDRANLPTIVVRTVTSLASTCR